MRTALRILAVLLFPVLLLTLLVLSNPMAGAFKERFEVVNTSDAAIIVTPLGVAHGSGEIRTLPYIGTPALYIKPPQVSDFVVEPGTSRLFIYNFDDVSFLNVLVRSGNDYRLAMASATDTSLGTERAPRHIHIENPASLESATPAMLNALPTGELELHALDIIVLLGFASPLLFVASFFVPAAQPRQDPSSEDQFSTEEKIKNEQTPPMALKPQTTPVPPSRIWIIRAVIYLPLVAWAVYLWRDDLLWLSDPQTTGSIVVEGWSQATAAKTAVVEFYQRHGRFPNSNEEAGLLPPLTLGSGWVQYVSIREGGVITIAFHEFFERRDNAPRNRALAGHSLVQTPYLADDGVRFTCRGGSMPHKYRPTACR